MQRYTVHFIWKLLYMFRVVPSPTIRSASNCIYSIWYLSHRYCHLPLSWKRWNRFECAVGGVDAVDTVACAPDGGWWYHPKHVEQFPDKINCITLNLVGYILEYGQNGVTEICSSLFGTQLCKPVRNASQTYFRSHVSYNYAAAAFAVLSLGLDKCPLKRSSSFGPDVWMILQIKTTADRAKLYRKMREKNGGILGV